MKIIVLTFISLILLVSAGTIHTNYSKPPIQISKQNTALNFNNDLLRFFSMGQKRLIVDLLWITTLLESDIEHYKKQDLNSWMYLRFKSIFELDPYFLSAYRFAGKYLSIIKDDLYGADEVFTKGLKYYPDDYNLIYDAGFLYAFELGDYNKAIPLYEKLKEFPEAPEFISSLIEKFKLNIHNDLNLTFKVVQEIYNDTHSESPLKHRLAFDLYRIKAEIDLECLNNNEINCSRKDFKGDYYLYKDGKYFSQTEFEPYRLKKLNNQVEN